MRNEMDCFTIRDAKQNLVLIFSLMMIPSQNVSNTARIHYHYFSTHGCIHSFLAYLLGVWWQQHISRYNPIDTFGRSVVGNATTGGRQWCSRGSMAGWIVGYCEAWLVSRIPLDCLLLHPLGQWTNHDPIASSFLGRRIILDDGGQPKSFRYVLYNTCIGSRVVLGHSNLHVFTHRSV
jgi:hypothetical protein